MPWEIGCDDRGLPGLFMLLPGVWQKRPGRKQLGRRTLLCRSGFQAKTQIAGYELSILNSSLWGSRLLHLTKDYSLCAPAASNMRVQHLRPIMKHGECSAGRPS